MASVQEQLSAMALTVESVRSKVTAYNASPIIYAAMGVAVLYGCKVTEGEDAADYVIALEGQAAGDSGNLNPDASLTAIRPFEFPNIASTKDGCFTSQDRTTTISDPPATGLGRYDVAYVYIGSSNGAGFGVAAGTPSVDVYNDFIANGLDTSVYGIGFDPDLPLGAVPVARIYVSDDVIGIPNSRIADLRAFSLNAANLAEAIAAVDSTLANKVAAELAASNASASEDAAALSAFNASDSVDAAALSESNAAGSETAAQTAQGRSEDARDLAESYKNSAGAYSDSAANSLAQATAVVVSGDVALTPTAGQVPLAKSNGRIESHWISKAEYQGNAVAAGDATTGILIPDNTEYEFTSAMSREFNVFIPADMTEEITVYSDGVQGIYITTDKKVRLNCYGIYESDPFVINDDYLTIALSRDDDETSTVSVIFMVNGVQLGSSTVSDYSDVYIRSLLDDEDGFFILANQGHGTLTSAGTNKLQMAGDAIGTLKDLSANAINFTQGTSAARPLIGRQPDGGSRNQITYSEEPENWSPTRAEFDDVTGSLTETTDSGSHVLAVPAVPVTSGVKKYVTFWIEQGDLANAPDWIQISTGVTGFSSGNNFSVNFNLSTMAVGTAGSLVSETSIAIDSGYIRIRAAIEPIATTTGGVFLIGFTNNTDGARTPSYVGDVTANVFVRRCQAEDGGFTDYQKVGASLIYDVTESAVLDTWFAYFDGSDDVLSATVPAITNGTILIAGTNGIWIDEDFSASAGTLSIGSTTIVDCPYGMLALVGKIIGVFCINRTLTAPELSQIIAMFKAKGSPGYFEAAGSELLSNGTFDVDETGWTATDATLSVASNKLRVTYSAYSQAIFQASLSVAEDTYYLLSFNITPDSTITLGGATTPSCRLGSGTTVPFGATTGVETAKEVILDCGAATTLAINTYLSSGFYDIDNISLKEITLNTGA